METRVVAVCQIYVGKLPTTTQLFDQSHTIHMHCAFTVDSGLLLGLRVS